MKQIKILKIIFWACYFFSHGALGQEVNADRPGFGTGTYTVNPGFVNIESGFSIDYENNAANSPNFTFPFLNLRFGITKDMEIGVLWDGSTITYSPAGSMSELSSLSFASKLMVMDNINYSFTLMGAISLPKHHNGLGAYNPSFAALGEYNISSFVTASAMLQITAEDKAKSTYYLIQPAIGLTFSHSSQFDSFIEFYMDTPMNKDNISTTLYSTYIIDGGFIYSLFPNMALDLSSGIIYSNGNQIFISAGFAIQI